MELEQRISNNLIIYCNFNILTSPNYLLLKMSISIPYQMHRVMLKIIRFNSHGKSIYFLSLKNASRIRVHDPPTLHGGKHLSVLRRKSGSGWAHVFESLAPRW